MGAVKINLSADELERLASAGLSILKPVLLDKVNHQQILKQLQNYHSDEDGAPIVTDFEIADVNFNPFRQSGQVRFTYTVDFTFACADKRATTNHTETSNFTIDVAGQSLTLFIHDKISRDTYEEF